MIQYAKLFILFIAAGSCLTASPEEPADSLSVDLQEIVVEGDSQRVSPTAVVYTPDKQQKQAATNAIDLLLKMGIPQLQVDILGNSATTVTGHEVSYFINFIPATSEELNGMRTKDVKRVEYLEYPSDPRFRGAEHVINYIMTEYEYGGYTKLSDSAWVAKKSTFNNFSIFSKFSYKKMTYDLYIGETYDNSHHSGSRNEQIFRLGNSDDLLREVHRTNNTDESFSLSNYIPVNFRASYVKENVQVSNRVWFNFQDAPHSYAGGGLNVIPSTDENYHFSDNSPSVSRNVGWNGNYFFQLPKDWSISANGSFNYSYSNQNSEYFSTLMSNNVPINNDATDRSYNGNIKMDLTKTFAGKHQVWIDLMEFYTDNDVHYLSSGDRNRFKQNYGGFGVGYSATFGNKVRLRADAGVAYDNNKINTVANLIWQPYAHLNLNYAPNSRNAIGLWFQYATNTPQTAEKSPNIIRLNELMYAKGNPDLQPSDHISLDLNWSWTPRSFFTGSVFVSYYEMFDNQKFIYSLYDNGNAVLRSYFNDSNFHTATLGARFSFFLLNRSLQIQASPVFRYDRISGENPVSKRIFRATIMANYYFKGFYATLGYYSPWRGLYSDGNYVYSKTPEYLLSLGWSNNDWNIRVNLKNIFESTWVESSGSYVSPYYSVETSNYGINRHRQVSLSLSYTFGYGRKINRSSEIGAGEGSFNAIMK